MNRTSRVERIETLKLLLAEREYATAAHLAEDLGVSIRTLHRDLATLRNLGVPVGGVVGRGGGVHLEPGWSLGRVHLNEAEAIGLLLSLAIAEQVGSSLLLDDLRSIERKITRAFAPSQATKIKSLRRRVLIGKPASPSIAATHAPTRPATTRLLLAAFTGQVRAEIAYVDLNGTTTQREIEPHYLYFSRPIWYVLAWDRLRHDIRSFRADRITQITTTAHVFRLRPAVEFVAHHELQARPI